jgi:hypothetical protein
MSVFDFDGDGEVEGAADCTAAVEVNVLGSLTAFLNCVHTLHFFSFLIGLECGSCDSVSVATATMLLWGIRLASCDILLVFDRKLFVQLRRIDLLVISTPFQHHSDE